MKYSIEQRKQLAYLKLFLAEQSRLSEYDSYLSDLTCDYTPDELEQLVKCVVHYIPYDLLVYKKLTALQMNEMRRYTEDYYELSVNDSKLDAYMHLGKKLLDYTTNEHMLYQFRRLLKYKVKINVMQDFLDLLVANVQPDDWFMACYLVEAYFKYGISKSESMFNCMTQYRLISDADLKTEFMLRVIENDIKELSLPD